MQANGRQIAKRVGVFASIRGLVRPKRFLVSEEKIGRRIVLVRGHKVMLSMDLAELYGVAPKVLVQAVKRNIERFPSDFMFQLSFQEVRDLKSQFVTSSWGGARRAPPYAFTRTGCGNVIERAPKPPCCSGQYHDHAVICETARDGRGQQRVGR